MRISQRFKYFFRLFKVRYMSRVMERYLGNCEKLDEFGLTGVKVVTDLSFRKTLVFLTNTHLVTFTEMSVKAEIFTKRCLVFIVD